MTNFVPGPVRVRVPATSANLGPGFDALGLALSRYDDLVGEVAADGLHIDVDGHGATAAAHGGREESAPGRVPLRSSVGHASEPVARDESHLVVRAMRAGFAALDARPPGLRVSCVNRVPHSRGLGSSAAAIVGGVLLARALVADGADRFPDTEVLALAARLEGHPDNVAPCLLGGLTISWRDDAGHARAVRRECDPAITPVVFVPPFSASTELARGLLPSAVPHADAAGAAGRAALLVAALSGAPAALLAGTEDRLHQAYRAPAMPESFALVTRLRAQGHAAVISGAGPSVLVLVPEAAAAAHVAAAAPCGWLTEVLAVDATGAVVDG